MKTLSKLDRGRVVRGRLRVEGSQRWSKKTGGQRGKKVKQSGGKVKLYGVARIILYDSAPARFVLQSSAKVNCNELQH